MRNISREVFGASPCPAATPSVVNRSPLLPAHRGTLFSAIALCAALAAGPALAAKPVSTSKTEEATATAYQDQAYALVQLNGEPLASYERTRPPKGKKIDFASNTARAYRAQLSKLRNEYKAWLRKNVPGAKVTGEFDISLNAVAVKLNGATLDQVSSTPMVRMAQYQGLYYRNQVDPVDPDLALILAEEAWNQDGAPLGTVATLPGPSRKWTAPQVSG